MKDALRSTKPLKLTSDGIGATLKPIPPEQTERVYLPDAPEWILENVGNLRLHTSLRGKSKEEVSLTLDDCLELQRQIAHLIAEFYLRTVEASETEVKLAELCTFAGRLYDGIAERVVARFQTADISSLSLTAVY